MGVEGELGLTREQVLRVLSFVDGQVQLADPRMDRAHQRYKEDFSREMNRRYRLPLLLVFIVFIVALVASRVTDLCCTSGVAVGLLVVYVFVVLVLELRSVLEGPRGYWRESVKDFLDVFEPLEAALKEAGWKGFLKVRASHFFDVPYDTTVYILDPGHPPVYVVVWKMGDKALIHVGYRSDEAPDRLRQLAEKLAWAA